jgi:hypothetical protein
MAGRKCLAAFGHAMRAHEQMADDRWDTLRKVSHSFFGVVSHRDEIRQVPPGQKSHAPNEFSNLRQNACVHILLGVIALFEVGFGNHQ